MQIQPLIQFIGLERSPTLESKIRERVQRLDHFFPNLNSCRVSIELVQRHHQQGRVFHVRIDVTAPGHEVAVNREAPGHQAHEDPLVAVRDAFDAMDRRLEDLARLMRGDVKEHVAMPHGVVSELEPEHDAGRIDAEDGHSVYFHRNAVQGDGYGALRVGSAVRFVEEPGEQGPQASAVIAVRHG